jgi:integrase
MLDLREKFRTILMSAEHEEVIAKHTADFERRKSDIKEMMEAALRASASGSALAPSPRIGELLSKVIADYCDSQRAENLWTEKTAYETRAGIDLWLRIVGDQPITGYGHQQHRNYKATLQKLPPNLNKMPRYRGLSISEIVALGDTPSSVNTVGNQLARIAALFNWAVRHGYTELNPASRMAPKKAKRANEERQAFSDEDLKKLFHGPEYLDRRHREPYMYWTPLIALYTGARLNEIAQLHLADFVAIDGGYSMAVNDQGESKRIKTNASKRSIPIHSELVRLGLLRFVEALRAKKKGRLFPELTLGRDGYGQTVSKWFRRYRLRCGVADDGKVFHSFRHTVINTLKQAGHPREQIAALVGHEDGSVTFGRYGKAYESKALRAVVDALPFACITSQLHEFC